VTRTFLYALISALIATPVVRAFARRIGAVAKPRADRWHQRPTALLGGVAIVAAIVVAVLSSEAARSRSALLGATLAMFALGVYDDRTQLRPRAKLLGQLAIVSAYVLCARPVVTGMAAIDAAFAVLFLAFVCNALNLLDHIDGLAAGAAAIGAFGLAHGLTLAGQHGAALFACAIAGAALGYFVFNVSPASIFMGDGGSLSLGFALGALAIEEVSHGSSLQVRVAPLAFLALPLLDASLVIVARVSEGRSISVGGRDHSSHRLVSLGLDDRKATMALHVAAMVAAAAGGFLLHAPLAPGLFAFIAILGLLLSLGSYLLHAPAKTTLSRSTAGAWLESELARHLRRLVHDVAVAGLAFTGAIAMRFDGDLRGAEAAFHLRVAVPVVLAQALVLHVVTRGRASWREAGGVEVLRVAIATVFTSAIAALSGSARGLVAVDGVLLAGLACASLFSRRAIDALVFAARSPAVGLARLQSSEANTEE
jgi:UDP-GlcNAc:undecaprenyl-phosphate GlcNAc-1-phosphate transferase